MAKSDPNVNLSVKDVLNTVLNGDQDALKVDIDNATITAGDLNVELDHTNDSVEVWEPSPAVITATGTTAISTLTTIGANFKLSKIVVHLSAAPTTSENLTVTLDSNAGSAYDTVLFSIDPSADNLQDIVYFPEGDMQFVSGD